jgi:hypothetical protein
MSRRKSGNKRKFLYFICSREESDFDLSDDFLERKLTLDELIENEFNFIISYDIDNSIVSNDFETPNILKSKKLITVINKFVFDDSGIEEEFVNDDEIDEVFTERVDLLFQEVYVFRLNLKTDIVTFVDNEMIKESIQKSINYEDEFSFNQEDYSNIELDEEYFNLFIDNLKQSFGKNTEAILSFSNGNYWDVKFENYKFFFGVDDKHNEIFPFKLMRYFIQDTGCILRVFTNQKVDNLPVKELYGFFLTREGMFNSNYLDLKESCEIDNYTGERLEPESNILYCDLEGNKLCSDGWI